MCETVGDLGAAPGKDEHRLVGPGDLGLHHGIVAKGRGHVLRLDRGAEDVDDVEGLVQVQRLGMVAQACRDGDRAQGRWRWGSPRPARREAAPGRNRVRGPGWPPHPPVARGGGQGSGHDVAADVDHVLGHARPCGGVKGARFGEEDLQPLTLQHAKGGVMQGGDGVVAEHGLRGEGVGQVDVIHLAALAVRGAVACHRATVGVWRGKPCLSATDHAACGISTFSRIGRWISAENAPTATPTHQTVV